MKFTDTLLDLLFPPKCPFCRKVQDAPGMCPACEKSLPRADEARGLRTLRGGLLCTAPLMYENSVREAIHSVLERTPPELVADISTNGIVMTGGGSLVSGFDKLVTARTGIHTMIADEAISCVALGTGMSLETLSNMQEGTMNLSRRKQMS